MESILVKIGLLEGKANWSSWKYKIGILLRSVVNGPEVVEGKLEKSQSLRIKDDDEENERL